MRIATIAVLTLVTCQTAFAQKIDKTRSSLQATPRRVTKPVGERVAMQAPNNVVAPESGTGRFEVSAQGAGGEMTGRWSQPVSNGETLRLKTATKFDQSRVDLTAGYGFSESFYGRVETGYFQGKNSNESPKISGTTVTGTETSSTSSVAFMSPEFAGGLRLRGENVTTLFEISSKVSSGPERTDKNGDTKSYFAGRSSAGLSAMVYNHRRAPVLLAAGLVYDHQFDGQRKKETSSGVTESYDVRGGSSTGLQALIQFPDAMNAEFGAGYSLVRGNSETGPDGESSASLDYEMALITASMKVRMSNTIAIFPNVMYGKMMRSSGSVADFDLEMYSGRITMAVGF